MHLRTLIVDDEPLARDVLRFFLSEEADIELIGECANGREAAAAIRRSRPDLVLLDVQMPGWGAFNVIREIGPEAMPAIIFVTAYDEYALRAFEVHAVDYLLKPVEERRLLQAIARARERLGHHALHREARRLGRLLQSLEPSPEPGPGPLRDTEGWLARLTVKSRQRVDFVAVETLDWIEAAGDYVHLHAGRRKHLLRETLANLETRLDPGRFQRIHRSAIVNLERIAELTPASHGEYRLRLKDGTALKVSRSFRQRFRQAFDGLG